jgi:Uma2 family endonuclease
MSPIGGRHMSTVDRINERFVLAFHQQAIARIQGSIRLTGFTEPQPDVILLKRRADFYRNGNALPADALLVVEVSDTTFRYDRYVKLPHYAAAGIPEYWVVNLRRAELHVFRNPAGDTYATESTLHHSDSVSVAAFPERVFTVGDIIG